MQPTYVAVTFDVREEAIDRLVAEAWFAGTLGCVIEAPGRLTAFFPGDDDSSRRTALPAGVREIGRRRIAEEDWLDQYRRSVVPIEVGERWSLDPRDVGGDEPTRRGTRTVLRLPARRAFGTGGHESTRLALRLIETTDLAGRRVVDLGYGSGVLAFAAAHRGAGRCLAVEHDLTAALVGGLNRALNPTPVPVRMIAGSIDCLSHATSIDVLMVNARPKSWFPAAQTLDRWLVAGGSVLCSGLLASERDVVVGAVSGLGWAVVDEIAENDWRALRLRVDR